MNIYEQSNTRELGSSLPELKNNIRFYDFLNAITSSIRCHSTLPNSHPASFSSSVLQAQGCPTSNLDSPNIFFGKFCSGRILFCFPFYIKADSDITISNSGQSNHTKHMKTSDREPISKELFIMDSLKPQIFIH